MSGTGQALLAGRAVPMQALPMWDHTYVTSSCGWVWRCWGNYSGGKVVVSGLGNSYWSNCISKLQGTAGIEYGVTGVCHQTANRILSPALIKVEQARGYNLSERRFGPYGTSPWPARLLFCLGLTQNDPDLIQYDEIEDQEVFDAKIKVQQMLEDRRGPPSPDDILKYVSVDASEREALEHMLWSAGVDSLSEDQKIELIRLTIRTREEQSKLVCLLRAENISKSEYLNEFNDLTRCFMNANLEVLGEKAFYAIYGEAGYHSHGLIDEETFYRQQALKPR